MLSRLADWSLPFAVLAALFVNCASPAPDARPDPTVADDRSERTAVALAWHDGPEPCSEGPKTAMR